MAITYDEEPVGATAESKPKITYEERRAEPAKEPSLLGGFAKMGLRNLAGGPLGAIGALGVEQVQKLIDSAAYKAGGLATDVVAPHVPPEVAAGVGLAANVGVQAIPVVLGGGMAKAAAPAMENAGAWLMQKALKPGVKAQRLDQAEPAIKTMLEGGYNATRGGAEKLQGHIDAIENTITGALAGSGATVDKGQVASRIQDVVSRIERTGSTPQDALKDVEKVYNQFMTNGLIPDKIPVQRAQELKRGIYQMLREKYGTLGSDTVEAQKALGRGYKETMSAAVPEITAPLAEQSDLIRALKLIERRAMTEGNNNPLSLGVSIATAVHDPLAALGLWANSSGYAKSMLARGLYSGSEVVPFTAGAGAGGLAGFLSGHDEQQGSLQKLLANLHK